MSFEVVSRVGGGISVLDRGVSHRREGAVFGVNLGRRHL